MRQLDSCSADDAAAMPNVVDVPLRALLLSAESPLARAIAGVAAAAADGGQHFAAHGSSPVPDYKDINMSEVGKESAPTYRGGGSRSGSAD